MIVKGDSRKREPLTPAVAKGGSRRGKSRPLPDTGETTRDGEKFADLFDFAPVALFLLDHDFLMTEVNLSGSHLLGVRRHLLIRKPFLSFIAIDSRKPFAAFVGELAAAGVKQSTEVMLLKNREEPIQVLVEGIAGESRKDGREYFLSATDITRRTQECDEHVRRSREIEDLLERRTAELNMLSYSVFHELREPLRHIEGFAKALAAEFPCIGSTGNDYCSRILGASQRISSVAHALMQLSRVSGSLPAPTDVDLSAIAKDVAAELKRSDPDRKAEFVIAEGIHAWGDPGLLRIVLGNLFGNAWKFSATRPGPVIEFGSSPLKGKTVCFVRDNGVGFDMAFSGRLFVPFQKLHHKSAAEGLGTGLAAAKRVIELHGGLIWAESAADRGATFFFSLPEPRKPKP